MSDEINFLGAEEAWETGTAPDEEDVIIHSEAGKEKVTAGRA